MLAGGPGQRGSEQGVSQRHVVHEQSKLSIFQQKTEMKNSGISSSELPVENRVLKLVEESFLKKKATGDQEPRSFC